jgi:hypothetical protein
MTQRHNHYEAAFEDYLRDKGIPYVAVDETRRAVFAGASLKSFDILVYPPTGKHWIADVKGRQFPYLQEDGVRSYWENWVVQEDLDSLQEWERVFGEEFEACFLFAYWLQGPAERWPEGGRHRFRDTDYAFFVTRLQEYQEHCRPRSSSWETVSVPRGAFRRIARPLGETSLSNAVRAGR